MNKPHLQVEVQALAESSDAQLMRLAGASDLVLGWCCCCHCHCCFGAFDEGCDSYGGDGDGSEWDDGSCGGGAAK